MANLAPAPLELKPYVNSETKAFEIALKDQRVGMVPGEMISQNLRYILMAIGIRAANMPDELEKAFLIGFIRQHYGGHTVAEIRLAFDMAITGRLNVDSDCYQNFTAAFFSKIMNAYRRWSSMEIHQVQKRLEPPPPTPEELEQIDREYEQYLQSIKKPDVKG